MLVLCYYWVLCNWMCRKVVICLCCCGFMLCGGGVVFCVLVLGVLGFRVVQSVCMVCIWCMFCEQCLISLFYNGCLEVMWWFYGMWWNYSSSGFGICVRLLQWVVIFGVYWFMVLLLCVVWLKLMLLWLVWWQYIEVQFVCGLLLIQGLGLQWCLCVIRWCRFRGVMQFIVVLCEFIIILMMGCIMLGFCVKVMVVQFVVMLWID